MGYRGQDLDLRTPQTWRASPSDVEGTGQMLNGPRPRSGYASEEVPIWVDETLLACCNHAFDVALAHRSAEVRIEHLLHALTRIEDAAEVLEKNGVNSASLRRETATLIASEIPVALANGSATPRRADTFEETLRLAAAHAYQRNAPASAEDLLYVFLQMRPQLPGVELVERNMARRARGDRGYRGAAYVPPPVRETPRERVRRTPGRFFAAEPVTPPPRDVQRATDHLQNSRLDALEQMVRHIATQISSQRDESSHFSGGVFDRLQSLEAMIASRPVEGGYLDVDMGPLASRIESLERLLRDRSAASVDLGPLERRLDALDRSVRDARPIGDVDLSAIERRLDALDRAVRDVRPVGDVDLSAIERRLDALDRAVRDNRPGGDLDLTLTAVDRRLEEIERAVRDVRAPDLDLSPVERRLGDIEAQLSGNIAERFAAFETKADPSAILSRLDIIEAAVLGADGTISGDLDGRIRQLADAAAFHQTTMEDARMTLSSEIAAIADRLSGLSSSQHTEVGQALARVVTLIETRRNEDRAQLAELRERLLAYEGKVEKLQVQSADVLAAYGEALAAHQRSVDGYAARSSEISQAHNEELRQVHDALVKLNTNQHTLAGSIDQWRSEGARDLSVLSARMQSLQQEAGRPMALLEAVSANMENMHRVTVERYHRRYRFWYWLFGTDDWVAASWPSQMQKIEEERRALNLARR